jgi:Zn-dependent M16 (insulinase) family peptidase
MIIPTWIHSNDPIYEIQVKEKIEKLRENLKNPNYLKDLIKKYFIDNKHVITLIMNPDKNYIQNEEKKKKFKLEEIQSKLKKEDILKIEKETKLLLESQNALQDNSCLPSLTLNDIPKKLPNFIDLKSFDNIYYNQQQTNGLVYITSLISFPNFLDQDLIEYLSLYSMILTKIGTSKYNYIELGN